MKKIELDKMEAAIRRIKKRYRAAGKTEDWLESWERGFRKVYEQTKEKKK